MRVYGKEELGKLLWNEIIQTKEEYTRLNGYPPDFVELTTQEMSDLKHYLKDFIPFVKTDINFEGWALLNMKLVIKD